jgi:hypothetical protein
LRGSIDEIVVRGLVLVDVDLSKCETKKMKRKMKQKMKQKMNSQHINRYEAKESNCSHEESYDR